MNGRTIRVWEALSIAWTNHDPMPTCRELCETCDISSTSVVKYHLRQLERRSVIRWEPRKARFIWVDVLYVGQPLPPIRPELPGPRRQVRRLH